MRARLLVVLLAAGALLGCSSHGGTTHAEFATKADALCRTADSREHEFTARVEKQATFGGLASVLEAQASWARGHVERLAAVKADEAERTLAVEWIAALRTTLVDAEQIVALISKVPSATKGMSVPHALAALGGGFTAQERTISRRAARAEEQYKALSKALGLKACG